MTDLSGLTIPNRLFIKMRDGANPHSLCDLYKITLTELKQHCRDIGDIFLAECGSLDVVELPVYKWSCS